MERVFLDTEADGEAQTQGEVQVAQAPIAKVYTPIQMHFLTRLQRLGDIREESQDSDALTIKLIGRGIYSIYRECIDAGVGEEARRILGI